MKFPGGMGLPDGWEKPLDLRLRCRKGITERCREGRRSQGPWPRYYLINSIPSSLYSSFLKAVLSIRVTIYWSAVTPMAVKSYKAPPHTLLLQTPKPAGLAGGEGRAGASPGKPPPDLRPPQVLPTSASWVRLLQARLLDFWESRAGGSPVPILRRPEPHYCSQTWVHRHVGRWLGIATPLACPHVSTDVLWLQSKSREWILGGNRGGQMDCP